MPKNIPSEGIAPLPDLYALDMNITGLRASKTVNAAAVIKNIGMASVSGPFAIAVQVSIGIPPQGDRVLPGI